MTGLAVIAVIVAAWLVVPSRAQARVAALGATRTRATLRARARAVAIVAIGRIGFGPASRRRRAGRRSAVIEALGALAAELLAGQPPALALQQADGSPPCWPVASATARMGGDVGAALRADGRSHPVLFQLAACWQVAERTGSGLAAAVDQLATTSRQAERIRGELEAQLAAPRTTARLLAGLPVIGVLFGTLLGADPVGWLLGTGFGRACLVGGMLFTIAGTWWTGRIAARVERML